MTSLPPEAETLLAAVAEVAADVDIDAVLRRVVETACDLTGAHYAMFTGLPSGVLDDDELPPAVPADPDDPETVVVPIQVSEGRLGELYLGKRGGFDQRSEEVARALAGPVGRAIANARLYSEAERRRRWLEGTVAMADSLARTVSVDEAEQAVAETVHRMSGAPVVAMARSTGEGPTVTAGVGDRAAAQELLRRLGDRMAEVVASSAPLVIDRKKGAATLILPLQPDVAPPAVLIVDYQGERSRLRGIEDDVMMTMGRHICLFLDRIHLTAERQRLLLATDRERIARDLHDLVIQRIFATGLTLQALRHGLDPARNERLGDAVHDLDVAMNDLRATIFELRRPPAASLLAEVEGLLDEYADVLGFRPALRYGGPVDSAMSGLVGDHALLALREMLSNAAKHARAAAVTVQITATPEEIALTVTDDGVGIPVGIGDGAGPGNGLANLRSRAAELGGTLTVVAGAAGGTRVDWVVPTVRARL